MKRRSFIAAIACLPLLGFLRPKTAAVLFIQPEMEESARALFSNAHTTNAPLVDDHEYYLANSAKMQDSIKWFDVPGPDVDFADFIAKFKVKL